MELCIAGRKQEKMGKMGKKLEKREKRTLVHILALKTYFDL